MSERVSIQPIGPHNLSVTEPTLSQPIRVDYIKSEEGFPELLIEKKGRERILRYGQMGVSVGIGALGSITTLGGLLYTLTGQDVALGLFITGASAAAATGAYITMDNAEKAFNRIDSFFGSLEEYRTNPQPPIKEDVI